MNTKAETKSISLEYDLPHPAVKVWRALTEPELLAEWLMATDMRPLTWTLTPTPSGGTRLTLEQSGFLPSNAFAFGGARKGWQRMVGERLREVLARAA
jgi:uncharacterized protein YndB with AHSA1/START domain